MRTLLVTIMVTISPSFAMAGVISVTEAASWSAIVNARIGITPLEESTNGFGRLFASYELDGEFNGFVFWIDSDDISGEPFSVDDGLITFLPGSYAHYLNGDLLETLTVSPSIFGANLFAINLGGASGGIDALWALPSTVAPVVNPDYPSQGGDKYYIYDVPMLLGPFPALVPEPSTLSLFGLGILVLSLKRSAARSTDVGS